MVVAVARISLQVPDSRSLKTKRRVVRQILDRVRAKFPVSASEVGGQDLWQRAELGFAFVSGDWRHARDVIGKVTRFVEDLNLAPVVASDVDLFDFDDEDSSEPWPDGDVESSGWADESSEPGRWFDETNAPNKWFSGDDGL